jgi:hypothetical protein
VIMKFKTSNLKQQNNKTISFVSNRYHLTKESHSCPKSIVKTIPDWYKKADIYAINPQTQEPWINPQDGGKIPTWKSCPAIFDVMTTGYVLTTPCDLEFYNGENRIMVKINDLNCKDFVDTRNALPQFVHPMGYDENHFAWWIDWGVCVPEGYSVLYTHPMNRFDLPFISTSGIVDNDKVHLAGTLPFFVFKGWTGIIPAGTPYSQLIPFKRENWQSNVSIEDPTKIYDKNIKNSTKYRVKNGGVYKNEIWEKRSYK